MEEAGSTQVCHRPLQGFYFHCHYPHQYNILQKKEESIDNMHTDCAGPDNMRYLG